MPKKTKKKIARKPRKDDPNDEDCNVCEKEGVVLVLQGTANCHYCGNQINLCASCAKRMKYDMKAID